jgi:hypothetical protein
VVDGRRRVLEYFFLSIGDEVEAWRQVVGTGQEQSVRHGSGSRRGVYMQCRAGVGKEQR